jgi:VanZ family protein
MNRRDAAILFAVYTSLIAFASLLPLSGWRLPATGLLDLHLWMGAATNRKDILINILIYLPFGIFGAQCLSSGRSGSTHLFVVPLLGSALSLTLEAAQAFLPARTTSLLDVLLNSAGTCCGVLLASHCLQPGALRETLHSLERRFFGGHPHARLGLLALLLWILAHLAPFIPVHDPAGLKAGFRSLLILLRDPGYFDLGKWLIRSLELFGLGVAVLAAGGSGRGKLPGFTVVAGAVLLLQGGIMTRQVSPEALAGLATAAALLLPARQLTAVNRYRSGLGALLAGVAIHGLLPLPGMAAGFGTMNWLPFSYHLSLDGIIMICTILWKFVAIAALFRFLRPEGSLPWQGAWGCGLYLFALEWLQQFIPGRTADITDGLVAAFAWWLAGSIAAGPPPVPADTEQRHAVIVDTAAEHR